MMIQSPSADPTKATRCDAIDTTRSVQPQSLFHLYGTVTAIYDHNSYHAAPLKSPFT